MIPGRRQFKRRGVRVVVPTYKAKTPGSRSTRGKRYTKPRPPSSARPAGTFTRSQYRSKTTSSGNEQSTPTTSFLRSTVNMKPKGQKAPPKNYVTSLVKANIQKSIYRWSGFQAYMNTTAAPLNAITGEVGGGLYWLQNKIDSIGNRFIPQHMYNITSVNQVDNTGAIPFNPSYQTAFSSANKTIFYNLLNQDQEGITAAGNWNEEDVAQTANAYVQSPLRRCLLKYVSINMMLYGARLYDTKVRLSLIQFKADNLDPLFTSVNTLATKDLNNQTAFYQHWNKPYYSHPLDDQGPGFAANKYIKTLKSWNFTIPVGESDELTTAVPHTKQIKLFIPMNKLLKFDWRDTKTSPIGDLTDPGAYTAVTGQQIYNTPEVKDRIYFVIQAFNKTQVVYADNASFNQTPSYDIRIRQVIEQLDG